MSMRKAAPRAVRAALAALLVLASAGALGAATKPKAKKKPVPKATTRDYARAMAVLHTERGDVTIRFFADRAPNHVRNFVDLAGGGFYDGTLFHRVVPGFILQGGDPLTKDPKNAFVWGNAGRTDAKGQPITLKPEFNDTPHRRGVVSMARSAAPDSASSQFFIVLKDYPSLDRQYTAFGEVVKGMDVVDRIVAESNPDASNASLGKPRAYQKLVKVEILEESAAPAPAGAPVPGPAPAKKG
ncbi:MAG: peptidylprolyl isomerase [Thermoanaerobaculia bacterium]|nr:peptidylprolyl isomerase [Thermoanaerobaculia bacterium]